ncbi:hypothetical protein EON66_06225 [archaeon]|nr:MAG: hypothetical protein EON66_06225 [archaeon]
MMYPLPHPAPRIAHRSLLCLRAHRSCTILQVHGNIVLVAPRDAIHPELLGCFLHRGSDAAPSSAQKPNRALGSTLTRARGGLAPPSTLGAGISCHGSGGGSGSGGSSGGGSPAAGVRTELGVDAFASPAPTRCATRSTSGGEGGVAAVTGAGPRTGSGVVHHTATSATTSPDGGLSALLASSTESTPSTRRPGVTTSPSTAYIPLLAPTASSARGAPASVGRGLCIAVVDDTMRVRVTTARAATPATAQRQFRLLQLLRKDKHASISAQVCTGVCVFLCACECVSACVQTFTVCLMETDRPRGYVSQSRSYLQTLQHIFAERQQSTAGQYTLDVLPGALSNSIQMQISHASGSQVLDTQLVTPAATFTLSHSVMRLLLEQRDAAEETAAARRAQAVEYVCRACPGVVAVLNAERGMRTTCVVRLQCVRSCRLRKNLRKQQEVCAAASDAALNIEAVLLAKFKLLLDSKKALIAELKAEVRRRTQPAPVSCFLPVAAIPSAPCTARQY